MMQYTKQTELHQSAVTSAEMCRFKHYNNRSDITYYIVI